MMWPFSRPPKDSLPPPPEPGPPTAGSGGIKFGEHERLPPSEPAVPAPQNNLSKDALVALVVARLRAWEDQDDSALRNQRLQELEALLNGTNMLEIVQELPPDLMGYAFALPSLRQKLMSDPKAALDWMSCHTNVSGSQVLTLIHDWGQENREEMRQYLAGLPEGEWKQAVMAAASNAALSSDPVEAIVWAGQMSPGERQTRLLEMAAMDWVKRDPDAATEWVGQVNDPALREQLLGSVVVGYADIDPVAAACVIQSVPSGAVLDQSVAGITWVWAMRDPAAAAAWVAQFPEGQARQMALGNLMNIWGNHDPAAAMAWIEGLPEGSLQTAAATDLLTAIPAVGPSTP
jgi:hypothetical protein